MNVALLASSTSSSSSGNRPAIAAALAYAILGIVLPPAAPIAWMFAAEQLERIDRGARRRRGRRALVLAQGLGIVMTMVAVAASAFGVTVLLVR